MLSNNSRYWGSAEWIFPKLPKTQWDLLGCISTEDRFLAGLEYLNHKKIINRNLFFQIDDPNSKDTELINKLINKGKKKLKDLGRKESEIEIHNLLEPQYIFIDSINKFTSSSENLIVDISCFPKRFFFPIIKTILKNSQIKNLLIFYTTPNTYHPHDLSANPDTWAHIPLFGPVDFPEKPYDIAIIGIGFMPFGLPRLLHTKYSSIPVKFLFPFPPGPPNYQRTWDFVRKIEKSYTIKRSDKIIRVNSNNASDAFDVRVTTGINVCQAG